MMKRFLIFATLVPVLALICGCYDDSAISSRIETLETRVAAIEQLNSDIESLRTIVEGLRNNITITEVTPSDDGYSVKFSDGTEISVRNGGKGDRGPEGPQGPQGPQGPAGAAGNAPLVSVKADAGAYWWTVNGEWLLDENGKKVAVSGQAPKLKLENDNWYASYDGGSTWTELAPASGTASGYFSNVSVGTASVVFTLLDGTNFEVPLGGGFSFTIAEDIPCIPGTETGVPYVVTGADEPVVYCLADGGYTSRIEKETATTGKVVITAPDGDEEGQVLVFASNGIKTITRCIVVSKGVFNVTEAYVFGKEAGNYEINVETNLEYTVKSNVDWITITGTKAALRNEVITISVAENPEGSMSRSGTIDIIGTAGSIIKTISVSQLGDETVIVSKVFYVGYTSQEIDPGADLADYGTSTVIASDDWISVNPATNVITVSENEGLVRCANVKYGSKYISIVQSPGRAFLDISFEKADGDLPSKNQKVANIGSAAYLSSGPTTYLLAYCSTEKEYSKPVTVIYDETVGHKVAQFHNDVLPSSYGSYLTRNSNGTTVQSMHDGFTVELLLSFNTSLWAGAKDSEANAFSYKSSTSANGYKALAVGLIGNENGTPVFTAILNGSRFTSKVSPVDKMYHHLVLTYDKEAQKDYLYVDGELVAEKAETRNMADVLAVGTQKHWFNALGIDISNPWCIGAYMNNQYEVANANWHGNIATCRVYGSTLTPAEVAQSCNILKGAIKK